MYAEDEYLPLSGIQHYVFCARQWALIHLEQQWDENILTVQGNLMHERAHDELFRERRGSLLTIRGLDVHSHALGLVGKCDVVEFHASPDGIPLAGEEGRWGVVPVEYKRGKVKRHDADRLQLCAQALCLEEMLACDIPVGFLYYGQTHSREQVNLDNSLREKLSSLAREMHDAFARRVTPAPKSKAACRSCSLRNLCLPSLDKREAVSAYMSRRLKEG